MQIRRVREEASEIERYVAECWEPYHEDLSEAVADHALVDDVERDDVVEHHRDEIGRASCRERVCVGV